MHFINVFKKFSHRGYPALTMASAAVTVSIPSICTLTVLGESKRVPAGSHLLINI